MSEWTVVTVIIAIVGLFFTVSKPIITLNSNIVKLNFTVEALSKEQGAQKAALEKQAEHDREAHKRLWVKNEEQDDKLRDHEARIDRLEESK